VRCRGDLQQLLGSAEFGSARRSLAAAWRAAMEKAAATWRWAMPRSTCSRMSFQSSTWAVKIGDHEKNDGLRYKA
jgi:hypothetical protein